MAGKLYGIGVGPGDPELLTLKAVRIMEECDVIAIPGENPEKSVAFLIAKQACPSVEKKEQVYIKTVMTKNVEALEAGYNEATKIIEEQLKQEKKVALLTLGDPTIYSTYIYIQRRIASLGYETEIISGVPSFCAAAARMGDSLVDRNLQLHILPASYETEEGLQLSGTKVFMKAGSKFQDLKKQLLEKNCEAVMIENCGMENEKIYYDIKDYPEEVSYYTIVVAKDKM